MKGGRRISDIWVRLSQLGIGNRAWYISELPTQLSLRVLGRSPLRRSFCCGRRLCSCPREFFEEFFLKLSSDVAALAGKAAASSADLQPSFTLLVKATALPLQLSHCDQVGHRDRRVGRPREIPGNLSLCFGRAGLDSRWRHKELRLPFLERTAARDLIQGRLGDKHGLDVSDLILFGSEKFRQWDLQQCRQHEQFASGYGSATDLDRGHRRSRPAKAARPRPLSKILLAPPELRPEAPQVSPNDGLKLSCRGRHGDSLPRQVVEITGVLSTNRLQERVDMSNLQALRDRGMLLNSRGQPCLEAGAVDPDAAADLDGRDVVSRDCLVELPAAGSQDSSALLGSPDRWQVTKHHTASVEIVRHGPSGSVRGKPARVDPATG